jgi:hypothetical protein
VQVKGYPTASTVYLLCFATDSIERSNNLVGNYRQSKTIDEEKTVFTPVVIRCERMRWLESTYLRLLGM